MKFCPSPVQVVIRLFGGGVLMNVDFSTLSFHDPTSGSTPCPNAGSVKPTATMMPRHNCFIVPSTQVQFACCEAHAIKHIFSGSIARRGPSPAAFAIHRASARPAGRSNPAAYIRRAHCLREGGGAMRQRGSGRLGPFGLAEGMTVRPGWAKCGNSSLPHARERVYPAQQLPKGLPKPPGRNGSKECRRPAFTQIFFSISPSHNFTA